MAKLSRKSDLESIIDYLDKAKSVAVLFVDQQPHSQTYSDYPWVGEQGHVIEITPEIVDHFQIGKVPQWRFYVKGSEVHHLIGTVSKEEFIESKTRVFGNLRSKK